MKYGTHEAPPGVPHCSARRPVRIRLCPNGFDDLAGQARDPLLGDILGPVGVDGDRGQEDPCGPGPPAGGGVVVGGVVDASTATLSAESASATAG